MPDPKLAKPWHGIPREQIDWHPTVDAEACIGCGMCVTGCGRLVYRFDYDAKKAVVVDPLNCMIACVTCANTCPTHAISFPPVETVHALMTRAAVRHAVEDELLARREQLEGHAELPHRDRIVHLTVAEIRDVAPAVRVLTLAPQEQSDCLCQFVPGQYLELWAPGHAWISRAYSIGNAPREDGSVELMIQRVPEGRVSSWVFQEMRVGDVVTARGPLGTFTVRSSIDTPLAFVAGGTGFAPVKAMIEQQLRLAPDRDMILFWGVRDASAFHALDDIAVWMHTDPRLRCILASEAGTAGVRSRPGVEMVEGTVAAAVRSSAIDLTGRDAYIAGPPTMVRAVLGALAARGVEGSRIVVDAFGA